MERGTVINIKKKPLTIARAKVIIKIHYEGSRITDFNKQIGNKFLITSVMLATSDNIHIAVSNVTFINTCCYIKHDHFIKFVKC